MGAENGFYPAGFFHYSGPVRENGYNLSPGQGMGLVKPNVTDSAR